MPSADGVLPGGTARLHHVLLTADAVGGVWTYALDLARELTAAGVRVSLAVLGPPPSAAQRAEVAAIVGPPADAGRSGPLRVDLFEHHGRLEWMDEPWADVDAAGAWLLDLEEQLAPDLVHLNGYSHGALPWRAPVLVAGHSCVLSWWRAVRDEEAPAGYASYAERVALGLRAADRVVAPTAAMLRALEDHYGRLPHGRVIANGRSTPTTVVGAGRRTREPLILTAGRLWDAAKNLAVLCDVAPSLPWPVYVAGEVSDPCTSRGAVPPPSVHYLGRLEPRTLTAWMSRAAIYVLPARYEPFGLSALEAAQAGCALVLGDIDSLREVWGDAAEYVPPDDPELLRQMLATLIADPARRIALARRSNARARQLTAPRMAAAYLDTYWEIVDEVRALLPLGAV